MTTQHTLTIYSSDAKRTVTSAQIATEIRVIVACESIAFVQDEKCAADAVLLYTAHDNTTATSRSRRRPRSALKLGAFVASVDEMISGVHEIKNVHLINGDRAAVLAALACSVEIKLAITQPLGVLKDYLAIDCMCREFAFDGRLYFLLCAADAAHLNGCVIEYAEEDGVYLATFYVRDREHLRNVVRHLHASIKGVTILPLTCKSLLKKGKQNDDNDEIFSSQACLQSQQPPPIDCGVQQFGECLLQQIDSVIDFHRNVVANKSIPGECDVSEEYRTMRDSLTPLEATTDLFHRQFNA